MATISANMQGLSLSAVLATQGPYYRTKKGQSAKYLPLSSVNNKQVGINYAGFSDNFLFGGLDKNIFNSLNKSYKVQKHTSRSEFNQAMSEAGKTASSLKNINYQKAEAKKEQVRNATKEAATALQESLKNVGFSKKQREILTDNLNNFRKFAETADKSVQSDEAKAEEAVNAVRESWEDKAGLKADAALEADVASEVALTEVEHYLNLGDGTAGYLQNGVDSLKSSLDRFEQLGRFDIDAKRVSALLNTVQEEAEHSRNLADAVGKLGDFAAAYEMDDDAKSTSISLSVLQEFTEGLDVFDESVTRQLNESIGAVQNFLREGKQATPETLAKAKDATGFLGEVAEAYAEGVKLNRNDQDWLLTSANDMRDLAKKAVEPFKQLATLENFVGDYRSASKEALDVNHETAKEVASLLDNYNDTVGHLHDRRGQSTRFDSAYHRGSNAEDSKFMSSLTSIGINVNFTGVVSVDTDKLSNALRDNPDKVEQILGKDGLAGRIANSVASSGYQSERMSPTINSLAARSSALLSPRWTVAAMMYGNGGNFMDMYL